jgi:hypothetical protein
MIRDKSFVIMDEIDSMINPLASDLNYPIDTPISIDNEHFIFNFTIKFIRWLLDKQKLTDYNEPLVK